MADASTLAALLGQSIYGGSNSGINDFVSAIAANDMYRQIAAPIMAAKYDSSTWSPGTRLGVSAGQAFLGSLLNSIGQRDEANQIAAVSNVLPQLYASPETVSLPSGVDPQAFGALKLNAIQQRGSQEAALMGKIAERLWGVQLAGQEAESKKLGEIRGEKIGYGTGGDLKNPNNPIEKKITELRDTFNNLEEVKNFKYVNRLSNQLVNTLKDPSAVSDAALAKMYVQFVEPKLATNAGEAAALAASPSIPESWKGLLAQGLAGNSAFGSDLRAKLLQFAKAAYDAHANAYSSSYDQFSKEAELYGIDPSRISAIGKVKGFESISGKKDTTQLAPKYTATELLAKGYTIGPNGYIAPQQPTVKRSSAPRG